MMGNQLGCRRLDDGLVGDPLSTFERTTAAIPLIREVVAAARVKAHIDIVVIEKLLF
jgi:hypothetical protein